MSEEEVLLQIEQEKIKRKRKNQRTKKETILTTELKRIKEAEAVGIVYLGRYITEEDKTGNYGNYRLKCNHESRIQATHVRRNNFNCAICYEERTKRDCELFGLENLGDIDRHRRLLLRIKACGHTTRITSGDISTFKGTCSECYENRLKREADESGLYIYKGLFEKCGTKRLYTIKECSHEKEAYPSMIRKKNLVCRICQEDNTRKIAAEQGLLYLGKSTDGNHLKRNFQLPCGCNRDFRVEHMKDGSWLCNKCDDTHLTRPSTVYLLKIEDRQTVWLKLGFAKELNRRISVYGLNSGAKVSEIYIKNFDTGYLALEYEKNLHKLLKSFRIKPKDMKPFMKNGHTECYPLELESLILQYLTGD